MMMRIAGAGERDGDEDDDTNVFRHHDDDFRMKFCFLPYTSTATEHASGHDFLSFGSVLFGDLNI